MSRALLLVLLVAGSRAAADTAPPTVGGPEQPMSVKLTAPTAAERAKGLTATFRVEREPLNALTLLDDTSATNVTPYDTTKVTIGSLTTTVKAGEAHDFQIAANPFRLQRATVDGTEVLFLAPSRTIVKLVSHPCATWDLQHVPARRPSLSVRRCVRAHDDCPDGFEAASSDRCTEPKKACSRQPRVRLGDARHGQIVLRSADSGAEDDDWTPLSATDLSVEFRSCGMAFVKVQGRRARLRIDDGDAWTLTVDSAGHLSGRMDR